MIETTKAISSQVLLPLSPILEPNGRPGDQSQLPYHINLKQIRPLITKVHDYFRNREFLGAKNAEIPAVPGMPCHA